MDEENGFSFFWQNEENGREMEIGGFNFVSINNLMKWKC
jgi:hypothetical protein